MPSQIKVDEIKNVAGQYEIKTDTFKGQTTAGSITIQGEGTNTTNLQQGLAKAWANYDCSGTASIRDNLNVTGLTDLATGYMTISLTNSMNNDDYVRVATAGENANTGGNRVVGLRLPSTGSFNMISQNTAGSSSDTQDTCVAVLGDLA